MDGGLVRYSDVAALKGYLQHEQRLMTDAERAAERTLLIESKAGYAESRGDYETARRLRNRWLPKGHEHKVHELLRNGKDAFWVSVYERILARERNGELTINRCPACQRILRTEAARQCLWCGHDWH